MSHAPAQLSPDLVVVGTLPPPVTGMTLFTEQVVLGLQAARPVHVLNWSSGLAKKGLKFRIARVLQVLRTFVLLLRRGRVDGQRMYLVANSSAGLYWTALFAATARRLGYQVYLHHHVYAYIDRRDWRMAWIDRRMGSTGVHVVHADKMIADFRRQYDTKCSFATVLPSIVSTPVSQPRKSVHHPFRLGHLSNLTIAKGFDTVIDTFERMYFAGKDVRLELAGPVQRGRARRLLNQMLAKYPDRIRYHGPLYDENKRNFYAQIDAFILPTLTESWGIVLHEAMCAGTPVISFDRGCTSIVVGPRGGLVIDPAADFAKTAAAQLVRWSDSNEEYAAVSQAAVDHALYLQQAGRQTLAAFVEQLFPNAPDAKVEKGAAEAGEEVLLMGDPNTRSPAVKEADIHCGVESAKSV